TKTTFFFSVAPPVKRKIRFIECPSTEKSKTPDQERALSKRERFLNSYPQSSSEALSLSKAPPLLYWRLSQLLARFPAGRRLFRLQWARPVESICSPGTSRSVAWGHKRP